MNGNHSHPHPHSHSHAPQINFDPRAVAQLATKYLNRVDFKGLQELHEFGHLVAFFAALQDGSLVVMPPPPIPPAPPRSPEPPQAPVPTKPGE